MTPGFGSAALNKAGVKSPTRVPLEECQEALAKLPAINL